MPRATNNPASRARRRKVLKRARGFFGRSKNTIRAATTAVERAGQYSFAHRRMRRREMRRLWIQRINAGVRPHGLSYSKFMHLLSEKSIGLDRKALAYLAFHDADAFEAVVKQAQS